jgi:hypothetical protein
MKKIYSLIIVLFFVFSISVFAQTPPPPNGTGGDPTQSGNTPVGGGAAIGGGLAVLLALGAGYGVIRYRKHKKSISE